MALSVQISTDSVPNITYALTVESIVLDYSRGPVQAPIPAANPLLVDLGQFRPQIVLEGTLRQDASETDGGVTIPDKRDLEDFVRGTSGTPAIYTSTITLAVTFDGQTDSYICKIGKCTFDREQGMQVWHFRMTLLSEGRS
tara:strand:- start:1506 stop:1928 length:423 start_codon:yes stop_codon:yes gene_type:complete